VFVQRFVCITRKLQRSYFYAWFWFSWNAKGLIWQHCEVVSVCPASPESMKAAAPPPDRPSYTVWRAVMSYKIFYQWKQDDFVAPKQRGRSTSNRLAVLAHHELSNGRHTRKLLKDLYSLTHRHYHHTVFQTLMQSCLCYSSFRYIVVKISCNISGFFLAYQLIVFGVQFEFVRACACSCRNCHMTVLLLWCFPVNDFS
jgi:hypothetical protein